VVIDYFNVKCLAFDKAKTQTPLLIDTNTPEAQPVAEQALQMIGRRSA
jgi:hypothetical protein